MVMVWLAVMALNSAVAGPMSTTPVWLRSLLKVKAVPKTPTVPNVTLDPMAPWAAAGPLSVAVVPVISSKV
jgi:hypothetical protein